MSIFGTLLLAASPLGLTCFAQSQGNEPSAVNTSQASAGQTESSSEVSSAPVPEPNSQNPQTSAGNFTPTNLNLSLFKNILLDQKTIWTSPVRLRWADGSWLFPLAAATAGFMASDRAVPPALSTNPNNWNRYVKVSDYGVYAMMGAGGGLYVWGKLTHNDHQRETGILAGEALADGFAVDTALKYAFGRQRPYQGQGQGNWFDGGVSFPSGHSTAVWSMASVIAHEYPGPLTQLSVYGLATAVSASRELGKQHFPSDVLVGAAMGWLIGRQVYRAHHDPELGGSDSGNLSGIVDENQRTRRNMGSTFVPLDSWTYAAFERLEALKYINTAITGLKPWTRIECARLTEEAGEELQHEQALSEEAAQLQASLAKEFSYEIGLLEGGKNLAANLESVYTRIVSISGPALTDGFHFGQTVAYDFGRPFERGTNGQAGGSFSADAGPLAVYVRAEYQHAPSAPAPSAAVVNFISKADGTGQVGGQPIPISEIATGPVSAINRLQLLDAYATVNMDNWQLVLGRQSLSWAPGPDSMIWNDNVVPVNMARLVNPEPFRLPGFLGTIGAIRIDQFFGRLDGHPYVPRPFVYGQKINIKPFSFLEIGFGRRTVIGGRGGDPLTGRNFLESLVGRSDPRMGSVPGDSESEMDWTFQAPKVRNYIVLYGDAYAEDDVLPIENPARNPWHPGIYITRIPGIPKLDFHLEGVSTEQAGLIPQAGGGNHGIFNYWNANYPDGNTVNGNLIGNTVGRDGRSIQSRLTYWISPRDTVQFTYRHNTVSSDFVPGGGAWQDYAVRSEMHFGGSYFKAEVQYENISHYPLLFNGRHENVAAILEVGFVPGERGRK